MASPVASSVRTRYSDAAEVRARSSSCCVTSRVTRITLRTWLPPSRSGKQVVCKRSGPPCVGTVKVCVATVPSTKQASTNAIGAAGSSCSGCSGADRPRACSRATPA